MFTGKRLVKLSDGGLDAVNAEAAYWVSLERMSFGVMIVRNLRLTT